MDGVLHRLLTQHRTPTAPLLAQRMALAGATILGRFHHAHRPLSHQRTRQGRCRQTLQSARRSHRRHHRRRRLPRFRHSTSRPCTTLTVTHRATCRLGKVTASVSSRRQIAPKTGGRARLTDKRAASQQTIASKDWHSDMISRSALEEASGVLAMNEEILDC